MITTTYRIRIEALSGSGEVLAAMEQSIAQDTLEGTPTSAHQVHRRGGSNLLAGPCCCGEKACRWLQAQESPNQEAHP